MRIKDYNLFSVTLRIFQVVTVMSCVYVEVRSLKPGKTKSGGGVRSNQLIGGT